MTTRRSPLVGIWILALVVAACAGGPILANQPASLQPEPAATPGPPGASDPIAIRLPGDDAAHHRLTEWWYYTGHLRDVATGARYGFEYVIFRAERGGFPVTWASHLAITDEGQHAFHYAQRSVVGEGVDLAAAAGFAFSLGADPTDPATLGRPAWTMQGVGGIDHLAARLSAAEAVAAGSPGGLGLDLALHPAKPAVLQGGAGWIDFGPAGGSYYYSRTDLLASGSIVLDGRTLQVDGSAWFDHQWGDFIAVGGGGWDWFAVNLADGSDLTLSLVRATDGSYPLVYGTLVDRDGRGQPPRANGVQRGGHEALDVAKDRRGVPGRLDRDDPGSGTDDQPPADRPGPGARHAGHHGRCLLGRFPGGERGSQWAAARRRRLRRADWLRPRRLAGGCRARRGAYWPGRSTPPLWPRAVAASSIAGSAARIETIWLPAAR